MPFAFPHIAERLFGRAHLIEWNAMRAILDSRAVRRILSGDTPIDDDRVKRNQAARRERLMTRAQGRIVTVADNYEYALTREGVAIVPIQGVLAQKFDFLAAICGWTTYEGLVAICDAIESDPSVKAILTDCETPGGEATGMLDASDALIRLNSIKPVWSVANGHAYSAGYALAGSSEYLAVPRLGGVGSIGAVCVHVDESAADKEAGLKYTAVFSGDRKIDGWEHAPLSTEARAAMQAGADHCRDLFAELVGRQGRITAEQALATEAACYMDELAVEAGLANSVGNFDETLAMLTETAADRPVSFSLAAPAAAQPTRPPMPANLTKPKTAAEVVADAAAAAKTTDATATAETLTPPVAAVAPIPPVAPVAPVAPAPPAAAAVVDTYTAEAALRTTELCAIAGFPLEASSLIRAKKPVAQVEAHLTSLKAAAADNLRTDATRPNENNDGAKWDKATEYVNKEMGIKPRT